MRLDPPEVALSTPEVRRRTIGLSRDCVAPRVVLLTKAVELVDGDEQARAAALIDQVRGDYPFAAALSFYCEGGQLRVVDLDDASRARARGHELSLGHIDLLIWDAAAFEDPGDVAEARTIAAEHREARILIYEHGRLHRIRSWDWRVVK
jgi:hypothetical protein